MMPAALAQHMPDLIVIGLGFLINAILLWITANFIIGPRGCGSFVRCLLGSLLMPFLFILIVRPLRYIFRGAVGSIVGWVFGIDEDRGDAIFFVFILSVLGTYWGLSRVGMDPVSLAGADSAALARNVRLSAHGGLDLKQFRAATIAALNEKLDGKYNVAFSSPEDEEDALGYVIRSIDGSFSLIGEVDKVYEDNRHRGLKAEELADLLAGNLDEIKRHPSLEDYTRTREERKSVLFGSSRPLAPGTDRIKFYQVAPELVKFQATAIEQVTPDAATCAALLDWQKSGAEGLTSATVQGEPAAWDLALSTPDLAEFEAQYDASRVKNGDYRKENPDDGEPNRLLTMIDKIMTSPYGDIEIYVEVHRNPRTAAEDVNGNRIRLPVAGRKDQAFVMEVFIPTLTRGCDRYVSVRGQSVGGGPMQTTVCMEGYDRDVWYRIIVPLQQDKEEMAALLRLMNMQKLKIARLKS